MKTDETRLLITEAECLGMVVAAAMVLRTAHGKWRGGMARMAGDRPPLPSPTDERMRAALLLLEEIEAEIVSELDAAAKW